MLPRRQSIFHLGEEGGAHCHRGGSLVAAAMASGHGAGRGRRVRERLVVGLQILVHSQPHHHHHHAHAHGHGHGHAASIVLKQMVRPRAGAGAAVYRSFLKACSLCRRELSPTKDVYMYRGDQGFCSEECRWQQIVVDEARENAAVRRPERRAGLAARHYSPHRTAAPIRGTPRTKTLAVA